MAEVWRSSEFDKPKLPGRANEGVGRLRVVEGEELPKPRKRGGIGASRMAEVPEGGEGLAEHLKRFLAEKKAGRKNLDFEKPKDNFTIN